MTTKIINGVRYDTHKAEEIAYWSNGQNYGDFSFYREDLYQTKKGNFFLEKEGGAMSEMAVDAGGNSTSGSSAIIPMDHDQVKSWMDENSASLSTDEIEKISKILNLEIIEA